MNEKKYKSIVVIWGIILLILQALALSNVIGFKSNFYSEIFKSQTVFIATAMTIIIVIYMILSLRKRRAGSFIGMLIGVLNIISFNIINMIIGFWFIMYSAWMMKELNQNKDQISKEKNKEESIEKE